MNLPLSAYYDENGLLAQKPPERDGGDSIHREMWYFIFRYFKYKDNDVVYEYDSKRLDQQLAKLYLGRGLWCCNPKAGYWGAKPDTMSRDAYVGLVLCLGLYKKYSLLFSTFLRLVVRGFFTTNTRRNGCTKENHGEQHYKDAKPLTRWHKFVLKYKIPIFPVPKGWRNYSWKLPDVGITLLPLFIRAFRVRLLWPVLCITDLELLIGSILAVNFPDPDQSDENNFILRTLQAKYFLGTPFSWYARAIYRTRPHQRELGINPKTKRTYTPLNPLYETDSGPQSAAQYYFRYEKNDPPLDLLSKDEVEKL